MTFYRYQNKISYVLILLEKIKVLTNFFYNPSSKHALLHSLTFADIIIFNIKICYAIGVSERERKSYFCTISYILKKIGGTVTVSLISPIHVSRLYTLQEISNIWSCFDCVAVNSKCQWHVQERNRCDRCCYLQVNICYQSLCCVILVMGYKCSEILILCRLFSCFQDRRFDLASTVYYTLYIYHYIIL